MERIQLIIEAGIESNERRFWGRVTYDNNLIVDQAKTVEELQRNIRVLLFDFHEVSDVEFELVYDLYTI